MGQGPLEAYRTMLASGVIAPDSSQAFVVEELEILAGRLKRVQFAKSDFRSLFRSAPLPPRGLYLFGGVGVGKTMLMDLFAQSVSFAPKRRIHFQEFMSEVHDLIADARRSDSGDPMPVVAKEIFAEAQLLCLDELEVRDIADAMILGRLFERLFARGLVLVATSNTAPRDLYRNGLNRPLFEPFIRLIEERCDVVALEAARDYRRGRMEGAQRYLTPADMAAREALNRAFERLTNVAHGSPSSVSVRGRTIDVPEAAMGVARFSFDDLCEAPLGPEDYRAVAHGFHTIVLDGVPVLSPARRNAARRFVTLIDALYDNGTGLIVSADAEPDALYPSGDGSTEFRRTASRLMEMRQRDLRAERAEGHGSNRTEGGLAAHQSFGQTSRKH